MLVNNQDLTPKHSLFRYYDPRVFGVYLPTCNADELQKVFGPVVSYLAEDNDPKAGRKFVLVGEKLQEDRVMVGS